MAEENQMYTIKKVVLGKGNKVALHYQESTPDNGAQKTKNYQCESNSVAHPDLIKALDKLTKFTQQVFGFAKIQDPETGEKTEVKKVNISHAKKDRAVVITANRTCLCGKVVALNTPNLSEGAETYGFEEELSGVLDEIEREALEFLIRGKEAQLDMFDQENQGTIKPLHPDAVTEEEAAVV